MTYMIAFWAVFVVDNVRGMHIIICMRYRNFEWDEVKDEINRKKHDVSFRDAAAAFLDENRLIAADIKHSIDTEERWFCFGKTKQGVLTVRFTYRDGRIRIFGAGYWREGIKKYERRIK